MAQSALDLDVWKEIAIAKQILIKTATDALGLDPECSDEELKSALEKGIKEITDAETKVRIAKQENQTIVNAVNEKLASTEQSRSELETANAELLNEKSALEELLETTRRTSTDKLNKANSQLEEKVKALKAINVSLADTPENVVKKIKSLNKKKLDETNAKKRAEDEVRALKKEKRELQKKLDDNKLLLESSANLVDQYRELRTFSDEQYTKLKELNVSEGDLKPLPVIDDELLKRLEKKTDKDVA